jgi:predicted lipase
VALIAQAYLDPPVRKKVNALLAADTSDLTAHDIASEATWADEYRNKNIDNARARTAAWHFVDIEVNGPNIDQACFGHPEPAQQRDRTRTVLSIRFKNSRTNWRTRIPIQKSKSSPSSSCCISLATSISRCMPQMTMTGAVMIRRCQLPARFLETSTTTGMMYLSNSLDRIQKASHRV